MAKQIKAAVVAALVVFVTYITFGIGTGVVIGGLSVAASAAVLTFATTLLSGVIGKMTSKGLDASADNFGTKFATREAIAPRQLIYGQARVGGTIVHMETSGTDNFLLHMVIAIAGHEIEELTKVRLNDNDLTTTTSTISGSTVHTVSNSDYTNTDNDNNFGSGRLIRFTVQDGSQTAVDGFMNAQLSSMGTTDKFSGVAYVYMQMVFDAEAFGGGIPATSFLVKGKKCFDPRTNNTVFTNNPALHIRDYLTNTEYGIKATTAEINDTTNAGGFASAANTCEQNVTLADGSTTEKRYTANGFTNFSANGNGVIESLLSAMAGKTAYVNGKFNIFAGASQTPSLTVTDDDLLDAVQVQTNPNSGNLFNSVKPVYVDSTQNYVAADAEVYRDTTMLNADTPTGESTANYVKQMETQLPFTVTDTMAQRLGRIALKSQRQTTSITLLTSLKFMRLQPNDWVYVTNERLNYSQKVFEVISTNMEVLQSGEVPVMATRLELKEIASSVFDFATNDYTTGQSEGSDVTTGDYSVTAPSNLSLAQQTNKDGVTTKVDIKATWTNNSSDKVTLTEVAYKLSTDGAFTSDFTVGKGVAVALLPNVVVGKTYNVKARHIDVNGVASAYTSQVNISISAPTDAPAAPTSLTASSGETFNILVSWINSTSADLKATKIYRRTSNTTPTDDTFLVDTLYGQNGKKTTTLFGTQDGLTAGTTYYFWIRAVNHSDVHSAFVGSASGSFSVISTGDLTDGIVTTVKLAEDAVTNAKIAVDAIQGDVIAAGAIVTAKLGVDAVTNAKLANNAVDTAQIAADAISTAKIANDAITADLVAANAITTTKISDDAISTAKISANAITANEINANAVTADKIIANAITTAKINAGAITTAKINAGAITADTIDTNAITAIKIIADAITTDKIAANAVTAAKITANTITASQIAADTITATQIAADTITATQMAANSITATEINVANLGAISANLGTITAGSIDASNVTITNLNADNIATGTLNADLLQIDNVTIDTDGSGNLRLGSFNGFSNINADSIGKIASSSGANTSATDYGSFAFPFISTFGASSPYHTYAVTGGNLILNTIGTDIDFTVPSGLTGTQTYTLFASTNPVGTFSGNEDTALVLTLFDTTSGGLSNVVFSVFINRRGEPYSLSLGGTVNLTIGNSYKFRTHGYIANYSSNAQSQKGLAGTYQQVMRLYK